MQYLEEEVRLEEVEEKKETEAQSCLDRIWYSLSCSAKFDLVIILSPSFSISLSQSIKYNWVSDCVSVRQICSDQFDGIFEELTASATSPPPTTERKLNLLTEKGGRKDERAVKLVEVVPKENGKNGTLCSGVGLI